MTQKKTFLMILLLAFVLRLGYALNARWDERLGDAVHYHRIAENLLAGKGYVYRSGSDLYREPIRSQRVPIYPLFVAGIYFLSGHSVTAVRIVQALLSTITCVFIYLIGKKLFSREVGLLSLALAAVYPIYIFYTAHLLTETLYLFLNTLLMLSVLYGLEGQQGILWFYSGLLSGMALLCRATTFAFLPFMVAAIFWLNRRKRPFRALVLVLVGLVLVVAPWLIRNYRIHSRWILSTQTGVNFYMGSNPMNQTGGSNQGGDFTIPVEVKGMSESEINQYLFRKGVQFAKEQPGRYGRLAVQKFFRLWRWTPYRTSGYNGLVYQIVCFLFNAPLILLLIPGMILARKEGGVLFLYLFIFSTTLLHMVWNSSMRFQLPMMPYVMVFSAYAFLEGWRRCERFSLANHIGRKGVSP